jgi:hypothetical protein
MIARMCGLRGWHASNPQKSDALRIDELIAGLEFAIADLRRVRSELHFVVPITETTSTGGFGADPP